jgi:hypothetical protein
VTRLRNSECKDHAAVNNTRPVTALLYFCSKHKLLLQNSVVTGVTLVKADSSSHPNDPAILLFGSSIDVIVSGGQFTGTTAGADMVVQQPASLLVQHTTLSNSNSTRGLSLYASDNAKLTISNSTFDSLTTAGAILAVSQASVNIDNNTFSNNAMDTWDDQGPGVIQLQDDAVAVITRSNFSGNAAGTGAGVALYAAAQVCRVHVACFCLMAACLDRSDCQSS